jgi:hypothetical protein
MSVPRVARSCKLSFCLSTLRATDTVSSLVAELVT